MSVKKNNEKKFGKEQIINSGKFGKYKDLLSAVLDEKTMQTEGEVNKLVNDYMKRRVD